MNNKLRNGILLSFISLLVSAASAQTLTITVRTQPVSPQAYIEAGSLVAGCEIEGERREMVLPRDERVLTLSIGDQPAQSTDLFSCVVSKREADPDGSGPLEGTPLPVGDYRVQCGYSGAVCLPWHRCNGSSCAAE